MGTSIRNCINFCLMEKCAMRRTDSSENDALLPPQLLLLFSETEASIGLLQMGPRLSATAADSACGRYLMS